MPEIVFLDPALTQVPQELGEFAISEIFGGCFLP